MPHPKRTARAGLLIHHTSDDDFLAGRVNQIEIVQQSECVKPAGDASLVIRRAAPDNEPIFYFCGERWT
jgi:hypothetical protein